LNKTTVETGWCNGEYNISMDLHAPQRKHVAMKRETSHAEMVSETYEENLNSFVITFW
jgi:hypothetical protein